MTGDEATRQVIDALNALGIEYMVVGSLSSNLYGIPRSTQDADFVMQVAGASVGELARRLGPGFRLDSQIAFETITATTQFVFTTRDSLFKIELFALSDDPHDKARFARRRRAKLLGVEAFVASPEDVIVTKLRWSRSGRRTKDLDDVKSVTAVQGDALDWNYIHRWCGEHDTRDLLDKVRSEIPPLGSDVHA